MMACTSSPMMIWRSSDASLRTAAAASGPWRRSHDAGAGAPLVDISEGAQLLQRPAVEVASLGRSAPIAAVLAGRHVRAEVADHVRVLCGAVPDLRRILEQVMEGQPL